MRSIRFIPAHAGNILLCRRPFGTRTVHPRTRGEHRLSSMTVCGLSGSSPHTRGTFCYAEDHSGHERFIPAHAGNMKSNRRPDDRKSVHPRTRGEHILTKRSKPTSAGSSPHTRGTSKQKKRNQELRRFIPAHAGNILAADFLGRDSSVHPRTRGEHVRA